MRGQHAQLSILFILIGLGGCASGGGGGNSPAQNRVLCGDNELAARPCSPTIGQAPLVPARTVSSTSTERTPLPATPATTAGTYEAIALRRLEWRDEDAVRSFVEDSDAVRIRVDPATKTYTVFVDLPDLTDTSAFTLEDADFGNHMRTTYTYSDGSTEVREYDGTGVSGFQTDKRRSSPDVRGTERVAVMQQLVAQKHVVLGEWLQREYSWDPDEKRYNFNEFDCEDCGGPFGTDGDLGRLFFAYGNRTLSAGMPVSGSATFRVREASGELQGAARILVERASYTSFEFGIRAAELTADFSRQMIAAKFDHPAERTSEGQYAWGIDLRGEAPFTADGRFGIPLSGNLLSIDPEVKEQRVPLTGRIEGAFFGPSAEEIGGVYLIQGLNRLPVVEGAFAADRE